MTKKARQYRILIVSTLTLFAILVAIDELIVTKPSHTKSEPMNVPAELIPQVKHNEVSEPSPEAVTTAEHAPLEEFIEIVDSCGPTFSGTCAYGHMHIDNELVPVKQLRNGIVLKVKERVEENNATWYRVVFDEWMRYPDRLASELLVPEAHTRVFTATGSELLDDATVTSTKYIIVDRSEQKLRAYDGDVLFMEATTSTGLDITPTPRGTFTVYRKTPSRYMQGPLPGISEKEYDLPGVPWNLYFTEEGAVIHGAYWHNKFGQQWSNGCVNLPPPVAKLLYEWAEVGMTVTVKD